MTESTLSEIAIHEAAHCVAAVRHGIDVRRVSVDTGEVIFEPPGDYLERGQHHGALAVAYGIVALAGQAAAPATGLSNLDHLLLDKALFLGSWSDAPGEMRHALSALTQRFVLDHWKEIEGLAVVLHQRRTMSGAEVKEIIGSIGQW